MALLADHQEEWGGSLPKSEGTHLPLRTREDLEIVSVGYGGRQSYVTKDPIGLKYHRLQPAQFHLLELLREPRTLGELQEQLSRFEPSCLWEIREIQNILADFHEKGLVVSLRSGQGTQLYQLRNQQQRKKITQALKSFLFLKFPGWSPEPVLRRIDWLHNLLMNPVSIGVALLLIMAAMLLVIREYSEFQQRLPAFQQFFSWQNLPYLWLSIVIAKIVHEFGHALACRHMKAETHQIGVMLLVFTPTLYCDVTDAWMLPSKWKRIGISLAGPFWESALAALALFFWWWTEPGILHFVCLNLFLMSAITNTVFNLNPLMRFDGYYVLSDYMEIPNLKQHSDQAIQMAFCKYGLGVELPRDPMLPETGNPWLLVYGIAAWCYRWFIMLGITIFLFSLLKPMELQRFAFLLLAFTLGTMVYGMFRSFRQCMKQIHPVKPKLNRWFLLGGTGTMLLGLLTLIPVPYWILCQFELEPRDAFHLYSLVPGELVEICVTPGSEVQAGDVLLRLRNSELEDQARKEQMQLEILQKTLMVARLKKKDHEIAAALEQIASIESRLKNLESKLSRLTLIAPVSGKVFPPKKRPKELASRREKLPQWSGTIFDARNQQSWLEKGTPILSLAPDSQMQAVLLIDQNDRNDLKIGQSVLLQCQPWNGRYWRSEIQSIGQQETDIAPESLSQKSGGTIVTVTDAHGREKMLSVAYRGIVPIPLDSDNDLHELMGATGTARVVVTHRTIAGWFYRLATQTFRFRL